MQGSRLVEPAAAIQARSRCSRRDDDAGTAAAEAASYKDAESNGDDDEAVREEVAWTVKKLTPLRLPKVGLCPGGL
jgi:hypothetical protein